MAELKPCPFCGGESHYSEYWPHWDTKEHAVWCFAECGGRVTAPTKTKAISAWNTRAHDINLQTVLAYESGQQSMNAEIERLRERERRRLADTGRTIWRDEMEGVCHSIDMCFEYGDRVRCGPCAIKASLSQGVDPDFSLPALPEVSRLKREIDQLRNGCTGLNPAAYREVVEALESANGALNAMAAQVEAEFRDHDKASERHEKKKRFVHSAKKPAQPSPKRGRYEVRDVQVFP